MGLLPGFLSTAPKSEAEKRADEVRTGAVAPTRAERARCWAARDAFYACLDAHGIVDTLNSEGRAAAARACPAEGAAFERDCAAQWVTYFKKWRVQDIQKKARLKELEAQGATRMDVQTDFTPRR
ncbi:uncharacterized protein THITE_2117150 [Thermothielavioides terrestris NRRL 8126]|uniref:Uncharacterized protein n=1 Tax=Thermothielavioides terrestris (strain ATCC 38088 / NRRL 8126) TaxID=578455 RepID=G2R7P6_THETT|nr:uncharacterized protein THITE_2117150 [Thermothielavioides terrestris NRRL 8126]AEO67955.1 hypothetical protein THITE_2117150 [Thermothielavioides terrestris NRRL 8126]